MFDRTDPQTLKKWLIAAAIVYFLLPFDLFPDFLGIPGRIDDVLILAGFAWLYRRHVQQTLASGARHESAGASRTDGSADAKAFDAYEILGITRPASSDAIHAAYRSRMKEYHPDKVAHLGEELQQLAHEKSQQIQRAYQQLRG